MRWYRFRSGMAKLAVLGGLAVTLLITGPDILLYLGGCAGGYGCDRLPDAAEDLLRGPAMMVVYSGLYFLGLVAAPILIFGGIVLELAARHPPPD